MLEYCPDFHLAQISMRKGAGEHVLCYDGSLKGLAIPSPVFEQKCSVLSYCQLQLSLFFTFCGVNHQCQGMSELCVEPLWYGTAKCHCQAADFMLHIYLKIS